MIVMTSAVRRPSAVRPASKKFVALERAKSFSACDATSTNLLEHSTLVMIAHPIINTLLLLVMLLGVLIIDMYIDWLVTLAQCNNYL